MIAMRTQWIKADGTFEPSDWRSKSCHTLDGTLPVGLGTKRLLIWIDQRIWGQSVRATVRFRKHVLICGYPWDMNWVDGTPGVSLITYKPVLAPFWANHRLSVQLYA